MLSGCVCPSTQTHSAQLSPWEFSLNSKTLNRTALKVLFSAASLSSEGRGRGRRPIFFKFMFGIKRRPEDNIQNL